MTHETQTQTDAITEMAKAGVFFGHKKSKTHPKMKPYVSVNRNEIEILNPEASLDGLQKAMEFAKLVVVKGKKIMAVGTSPAAKEEIKQFSENFGFPYVISRWLGGTLTNTKTIQDRLAYYENLKHKQETGELGKYTKKEQLEFQKTVQKMSQFFSGLVMYKEAPGALFIVNLALHQTALKEAKKMKIPVIAIVDSNDNPEEVEYPIIGNDHSRESIHYILEKVKESIQPQIDSRHE